ncbi:MAG: methionine adenosyltransferase [Kordiimonas sp.]|nr:methionine adenosyltransferase [Kordiimonas sp.]
MTRRNYLFTSESVSEGHPDKVADQISDAILDLYLSEDPEARVAVETLTTTNRIVLAGEVRGPGSITPARIEEAARQVVRQIGYEQDGFHWAEAAVDIYIHDQSAEIAKGVDASANKDEGAGDQGIMFGFACDETDAFMPAPLYYAHNTLRALSRSRHAGAIPELGPDAKSQVSLRYENGVPVAAESIVVSTQHQEGVSQERVRDIIRQHVETALPDGWMCGEEDFYVNPTGTFVVGGPDGDAGLTGRKIVVDTYGGAAPHGGGAFSGKDPTKVDRSAAYAARYLAKNVVAAGLAKSCVLQLSYAIGVSDPLSLYVDLEGGEGVDVRRLEETLRQLMDLTPRGIREHLQLNQPFYLPTASYGHFGRTYGDKGPLSLPFSQHEGSFPWEKLDLVDHLKAEFL